MDADLPHRLAMVAERLEVPREEDGTEATLVALMPCEPAVGEVVVACWTDSDGAQLVELVRLEDATRLDDAVALREALTLLAMVETVEELAAFDELDEVAGGLAAWVCGDDEVGVRLARARDEANARLGELRALAPGEVRMARTQRLDALGAAFRGLESAWATLERAAEAWSDAYLAAHGSSAEAVEHVQQLWGLLGQVRRGQLSQSMSAVLHEAREAGVSMATAVSHTS